MSKKAKVYDIFTRKDMEEERQDTDTNDHIANEVGKYVGAIQLNEAEALRDNLQRLQTRQEQIDAMIKDWEEAYRKHQAVVWGVLKHLNVKDFDPNIHDVFIAEDGHIWVVERDKLNPKPGYELH